MNDIIEIRRHLGQKRCAKRFPKREILVAIDVYRIPEVARRGLLEHRQAADNALEAFVGLMQCEHSHLELVEASVLVRATTHLRLIVDILEGLPELGHRALLQLGANLDPNGFVDGFGNCAATQFRNYVFEIIRVVIGVVQLRRRAGALDRKYIYIENCQLCYIWPNENIYRLVQNWENAGRFGPHDI